MKNFKYAIIAVFLAVFALTSCNQSSQDASNTNENESITQTESTQNSLTQEDTNTAARSSMDVILIQGYDPGVALDGTMPKYGSSTFTSYWTPKVTSYWAAWKTMLTNAGHRVRTPMWSSKDRMVDAVAGLAAQIQAEMDSGFCASSCVIVSHSTGGPVTASLLETAYNKRNTDAGYFRIWQRVPYTIDLAPAWNGAILAELVVNIAKGSCSNSLFEAAAGIIVKGVSCNQGADSVGVSNDLVRSYMVNHNGVETSYTTHFPISGDGSEYLYVTSPIIPGNDDGVLSADSTCGSRSVASYDSCSSSQTYDGAQKSKSAPSSIYNYVYPLIMTGEGHGQMTGMNKAGEPETLINHTTYGRTGVTEETESHWYWLYTYKNLKNDDTKSVGDFSKDLFF
jgi:hypothetical protein